MYSDQAQYISLALAHFEEVCFGASRFMHEHKHVNPVRTWRLIHDMSAATAHLNTYFKQWRGCYRDVSDQNDLTQDKNWVKS